MHNHQPSTDSIDQVMQHIRITNAIHCRIQAKRKQHDIVNETPWRLQARDDVTGRHGLDDENVGHDGEDVVV